MKERTKLTLAFGLAVVMAVAMIQAGSWIRPASIAAAAYSDPVGFVKVDIRRDDYSQIAIPLVAADMALNDTDDSVTCLGEMLSETLIGDPVPDNCPKIYKYLVGGGFEGAFLYDSGGSPAADNKWYNTQTFALSTLVLDLQTGYYAQRIADGGSDPQTPTVLGDVDVSDTISVSIPTNFSMFAYPYPKSIGVNDADGLQTEDGAYGDPVPDNCDKIYKYQAGGGFEGAFLYNSGGSPAADNKWYNTQTFALSTMTLDLDEGAYYWRNPAQGAFVWVASRPFSLP
jgi:hypothetical protein